MGLWRDILRLFGLVKDARVQISAPGIDVVITGEPEQVRSLLGVVKYELERDARWKERRVPAGAARLGPPGPGPSGRGPPGRRPGRASVRGSQVVLPTELDEMDSPYALPDALVMPVEDTTGEHARADVSGFASDAVTPHQADRYLSESDTVVPDRSGSAILAPSVRAASRAGGELGRGAALPVAAGRRAASTDDGPEREITAVVPKVSDEDGEAHAELDDANETTSRGS